LQLIPLFRKLWAFLYNAFIAGSLEYIFLLQFREGKMTEVQAETGNLLIESWEGILKETQLHH
jgi:hypothetical protein